MMVKWKTVIKYGILIAILLLLGLNLYKTYSFDAEEEYLKLKLNFLMENAYDTYGERLNEEYTGFISKDDFKSLDYRDDKGSVKRETNSCYISDIKITDNKAEAEFRYHYASYDKNDQLVSGSGTWYEPIPIFVELEKKSGQWKVTSVTEEIFPDGSK